MTKDASYPLLHYVLCSLILVALLFGCSKSPEELARQKDLATVKRIALVGFVGNSVAGRKSSDHEPLLKATYEAFQKKASGNRDVVDIIPIEAVIKNDVYTSIAIKSLPNGVISPVAGLTRLKQISVQDIEGLSSALKVDGLLTITVNYSINQENNASRYVLGAIPHCTLFIPSGRLVWGGENEFLVAQQVELPISLFSNSALSLSLGLKWAAMGGPSEADYIEMMKIATESGRSMAAKTGELLFDRLVNDIRDARATR